MDSFAEMNEAIGEKEIYEEDKRKIYEVSRTL